MFDLGPMVSYNMFDPLCLRGGKEADMDRRRGKYSKVVEEEEEEEEQLQGARMVEMV
jgi:hypothetical protein